MSKAIRVTYAKRTVEYLVGCVPIVVLDTLKMAGTKEDIPKLHAQSMIPGFDSNLVEFNMKPKIYTFGPKKT